MKKLLPALITLYDRLLRLFPRAFRADFGEEMRLDFVDMLEEAGREGTVPVFLTLLRELRDLPADLLRAHLEEGGMLKLFRSQPVNSGLRGAVGFGLASALASLVSQVLYWTMTGPDVAIVSRLQVDFFDLFDTEHGLELIGWIPSALSSLITGLVLGLLLAFLFAERSKYPRYILAGILGWFLHDAVERILMDSLDLGFLLGTRHFFYFFTTLSALSGAFLGLIFLVARSERQEPMHWLAAGVFVYPLVAYLYVRLLFRLSIITTPWLFIALMILLVIYLGSVVLIAIKSETASRIPWMVVAGALAYSVLPYVASSIYVPAMPGTAFFGIAWPLTLHLAIYQAIYGVLIGVALGLILALQRKPSPAQPV